MKTCAKCSESKPRNEFSKDRRKRDGLGPYCKVCKAAYGRMYYRKNRERECEKARRWRAENPEEMNEYNRWYRATGRVRASNHRSRAQQYGITKHWTVEQLRALIDYYGRFCLRCGKKRKLTVDHVVPISQGGSNDIGNIQPLCKSCNSAKSQSCDDYRPDGGLFARKLAQQEIEEQ